MAISLTYAFGTMGRHIRKTCREARAYVGANFRYLEASQLRDALFWQYFAIDLSLFSVFYNEDPTDALYPIHKKYAGMLLGVTDVGFRRIARAYALSLLAGQPLRRADEEEAAGRLNVLRLIAFIYDRSGPTQFWTSLVLQPDEKVVAGALCLEIADAIRLDPPDKTAFSTDWLSLVPGINAGTKMFLAKEDWSEKAASLMESVDFGGNRR
jgi:hypothetical protein